MLKSKSFSLLVLPLFLVGCSKTQSPKPLISKWQPSSASVVERRLASAPKNQCLQDIFSVETLKAEIKDLELPYVTAPKVKGEWRHLDLSDLPVPQANFLKSYGAKIGDQTENDSIDYSRCEDVPCIINRIYGGKDSVAGYVHYLWYLKFGHYLAADNHVPGSKAGRYNAQDVPLKDYLYSDKELYAIWRLSLMLSQSYKGLSKLGEIQRLPRGHHFEERKADGTLLYSPTTCGLASSGGWIKLKDSCLEVSDNNNDSGYLYVAFTHEVAHHVDYHEASKSKLSYRSHELDYANFNFEMVKEWVEYNWVKREWKVKDTGKFISSYARTSPAEDFAETLARFRVNGEQAKYAITDAHVQKVSKEYYNGLTYDRAALYEQWLKARETSISKDVFKAVMDCSNSGGGQSKYFTARDFSVPVTPTMLNCLGAAAQHITAGIDSNVKIYEPDGCEATGVKSYYANEIKPKWEAALKKVMVSKFGYYLQELNKDKNYLARMQSYYDELAKPETAYEAYFECYEQSDEQNCFEKSLKDRAFTRAGELLQGPDAEEWRIKEMAEMYISYHSFAQTRSNVMDFYQTLISANEDLIRRKGEEVWASCREISHNDDESPVGSIFKVGDEYMISSFYNCLNAQLPDTITDIVRELALDGMKVQHSKEEMILSRQAGPVLDRILKESYRTEKEEEASEAKKLIAGDQGQLRQAILKDFNWVSNVVDNEQILRDCKVRALEQVSMLPLYHTKRELFTELVDSACANITEAQEYNRWLQSAEGEFKEKIVSGLEDKLMVLANAQADNCIKQYPVDSSLNRVRYKRQREECLTKAWPEMETQVIQEAESDPLVKKFKTDVSALKTKLETSRRRLQLRIIKERFN